MFPGDCTHSLCQFFFVLVGQRNQFGLILFDLNEKLMGL